VKLYENGFPQTGNNAPLIISDPLIEGRVGVHYEYQVQAMDYDGDALAYELTTGPLGMLIAPNTGLITLDPVDGHLGMNRVGVQVRDQHGATDEQTFYIAIDNWLSPNSNPEIANIPNQTVLVNSVFSFAVEATDAEDNQITFSLLEGPANMVIGKTSGLIEWITTEADWGTTIVSVEARDARDGVTSASFTIDIQYPVLFSHL